MVLKNVDPDFVYVYDSGCLYTSLSAIIPICKTFLLKMSEDGTVYRGKWVQAFLKGNNSKWTLLLPFTFCTLHLDICQWKRSLEIESYRFKSTSIRWSSLKPEVFDVPFLIFPLRESRDLYRLLKTLSYTVTHKYTHFLCTLSVAMTTGNLSSSSFLISPKKKKN